MRCKVVELHKNYIIAENNEIGYKIYLSSPPSLEEGKRALIYLFREFKIDTKNQITSQLYGFLSQREYSLFQALTAIKGIGCKTAQTILINNWDEIIELALKEERLALSKLQGFNLSLSNSLIYSIKKSKSLRNLFLSIISAGANPKDKETPHEQEIWNVNEIIDSLTEIGYDWDAIKKALDRVKQEKASHSDLNSVINKCLQTISQDSNI